MSSETAWSPATPLCAWYTTTATASCRREVPPSQRRLLLPSFPTGRPPFPQSDITTVATEQTPPMGLSPIGTSASIAAQAPSLHRSHPASSVLRASPPSQTARPVSRELQRFLAAFEIFCSRCG